MLALGGRTEGPVWGCDFAAPMLAAARRKLLGRARRFALMEADALRLPLPDASLDVVTIAFGLRNLADYGAGLTEMARVLRPGGTAAILEFSTPPNRVFGALYAAYSHWVLPAVGRLVSGSPDAYAYLPESVRRFPRPEELAAGMERAGFRRVSWRTMTGGIVALYLGWR
jgi:demethylmenaquinone methyltransferase/2-methoxy-6-polyprenyl-1,4-benzoquinol methylase